MSNNTKLSEKYRSDPLIYKSILELNRKRNHLRYIMTDLSKIASDCSAARISNMKSSNCEEIYCEDLKVLWIVASDCMKLCDSAISRLDSALEDPTTENGRQF